MTLVLMVVGPTAGRRLMERIGKAMVAVGRALGGGEGEGGRLPASEANGAWLFLRGLRGLTAP